MVFCTEHWTMLPRMLRDGVYASKQKPQKHRDAGVCGRALARPAPFQPQQPWRLEDQDLQHEQSAHMRKYSEVLGRRIARF
jgi:hypothetical protein